MRELVSKPEGGCMSARFHLASRARTRAAERQISTKCDCCFWGRILPVSFLGGFVSRN